MTDYNPVQRKRDDGFIYEDNNRHCWTLKLNEPSNVAFVFQFPNGDKVECPDCKSLQDFIDKLNRYSDVKEENARLKDLLKDVKEFIVEENPKDYTIMSERMDELLEQINEVQ